MNALKEKKEELYNSETDIMKEIINPFFDIKKKSSLIPVESEAQGEYLRQRLTKKFGAILKECGELGEVYNRPIPRVVQRESKWYVLINRKDGRRNSKVWGVENGNK